MRAKAINEINFERGGDPKESLDIGIIKDSGIKEISDFLKGEFKNSSEADYYHIFWHIDRARIKITNKLLLMALKSEFPAVDFSIGYRDIISGETPDGYIISFNPSSNNDAFTVVIEEKEFKPGKTGKLHDKSKVLNNFPDIKELIDKKAEKWGIKVKEIDKNEG